MEKNKYIEVIDRYAHLLEEGAITFAVARWATHAVILCAMRDSSTTPDDYCYILGYRDRVFE